MKFIVGGCHNSAHWAPADAPVKAARDTLHEIRSVTDEAYASRNIQVLNVNRIDHASLEYHDNINSFKHASFQVINNFDLNKYSPLFR